MRTLFRVRIFYVLILTNYIVAIILECYNDVYTKIHSKYT